MISLSSLLYRFLDPVCRPPVFLPFAMFDKV
jgi:hypothetical protein